MHIIINESQLKVFQKLSEEDSLFLDNGNIKKEGDTSQIGTSATIHDADGNPKMGHPTPTDRVSHELANQHYFGTYPLTRRV
jgi:hypothetical protein